MQTKEQSLNLKHKRQKSTLNKTLTLSLSILLTSSIVFHPVKTFAAGTEDLTVTFAESPTQEQNKVITLPSNFDSIELVSVNTGEVDYSISGNEMTINVFNGKVSSKESFYNPTLHSKEAISVKYSDTNSFPDAVSYLDDNDYSGTLTPLSSAYIVSGSYTPPSNKTVTVSQTVSNPSYLPDKLEYNKNNYSGTLFKNNNYVVNINGDYVQYYSGTVYSKDNDTRKWRQDYSGEVYKGGTDYKNYKYSYTVTITYKAASSNLINCSYKGFSPSSVTATNFRPKCVTLDNGSSNLYTMKYNFSVTGISDAGAKGK
ncbi:hypothetical protein WKH56_07890 [Priestia sp. SB1]|uniref:Uncharacterized protein n=1 Tax=Priestia aryabhattai TaxID=412384 RepID=A0AAX6NE04_PRIAR|nr:hypothetical protein [Priestia aryabhattai]MDU9694141.1 hypothetical protein [Priestia aryabhattai]